MNIYFSSFCPESFSFSFLQREECCSISVTMRGTPLATELFAERTDLSSGFTVPRSADRRRRSAALCRSSISLCLQKRVRAVLGQRHRDCMTPLVDAAPLPSLRAPLAGAPLEMQELTPRPSGVVSLVPCTVLAQQLPSYSSETLLQGLFVPHPLARI